MSFPGGEWSDRAGTMVKLSFPWWDWPQSVSVLLELQDQVWVREGCCRQWRALVLAPGLQNSGVCLACSWLTFPMGLKGSEEQDFLEYFHLS